MHRYFVLLLFDQFPFSSTKIILALLVKEVDNDVASSELLTDLQNLRIGIRDINNDLQQFFVDLPYISENELLKISLNFYSNDPQDVISVSNSDSDSGRIFSYETVKQTTSTNTNTTTYTDDQDWSDIDVITEPLSSGKRPLPEQKKKKRLHLPFFSSKGSSKSSDQGGLYPVTSSPLQTPPSPQRIALRGKFITFTYWYFFSNLQ